MSDTVAPGLIVAADDLTLAGELVVSAGRLAAGMRRVGVSVARKTSISDIVTAADHAAEELIVTRLRVERPADGIVGEEGAADPGDRTWFVDPVDGTYNYAAGLPEWCAALALRDGDGVVLGAVYQPSAQELWLGGRDQPTTLNGVRVAPVPERPLSDISLVTYLHPASLPEAAIREPLLRVMQAAATVRMLGSGSVELSAVAGGRVGAYIQRDCLDWDWFPGAALVQAAGGSARVLELDGHRWHLAGNHRAVHDIMAVLLP